ncbi:MAG: hypothetical protein QOJ21_961, partial [Solirubrobacteraceae bacterium]|nr:hypothetical protein [Solirubrobacteraceae bacterium]
RFSRLVPAAVAAGALAVPAAAQASPYSAAVLADSPLAYYRLNEPAGAKAAVDDAGAADGTYSGVELGAAAPFPGAGTSGRLTRLRSWMTASPAGVARSAELWVMPTSKDRVQTLLAHGNPAGDGWAITISSRKRLSFTSHRFTTSSKVTLPVGKWSMVAVTWEAGRVRFYVNGAATTARPGVGRDVPLPGPAQRSALFAGGIFTGGIDEVALYRTTLTAAQIGGHYASTSLPTNDIPAAVTGTAEVGAVLTAGGGSWTGATTDPTYQWVRCDATGALCEEIPGATGPTYTVTDADAGSSIAVIETVGNASGATSTMSDPVGPIAGRGQGTPATPVDPGVGTTPDPDAGTGTTPDPGTGTGTTPGAGTGTTPGTDAGTTPGGDAGGSGTGTTPTATGAAASAGSVAGLLPVAGIAVAGDRASLRTCPTTLPARVARTRTTRRSGRIRLDAIQGAPGAVRLTVSARRRAWRSVSYRVDGRRVGRVRTKAPFARLTVKGLSPGMHTVVARLTPKHGKAVTVRIRARLAAC